MELSAFDSEERLALAAAGLRPGMFGTGCPDPSVLLAVEDGVLDGEAADAVRAHVATCQACAMLTSDLASVFAEGEVSDASVRIAARLARTPAAPQSRKWVWGLTAAGVLMAASLAAFVVRVNNAPLPSISHVATASARPLSPPTVFVVEDAPAEPADVELTLRGESSVRTSRRSDVDARLLPAADEIEWRKAVALVTAGNSAAARPMLEALCAHPTWRGALACAGLIELDRQGKR